VNNFKRNKQMSTPNKAAKATTVSKAADAINSAAAESIAAQRQYLDEKGAAEGKAQERTSKAVQMAAAAFHAEKPNAKPVEAGRAILRAIKSANEKSATKAEQVPASRISRALKAAHIEGWTEEGKGIAVRVHAPKVKDTSADLVKKIVDNVARYVDAVNDRSDLDKVEKLIHAAFSAKRAALATK
jgi:hypothetical protein